MTQLPTTFNVDDRRLSLPPAPFCDEGLLTLPMDAFTSVFQHLSFLSQFKGDAWLRIYYGLNDDFAKKGLTF